MAAALPVIGPALSVASTLFGRKEKAPPPPPVVRAEPPKAPSPDPDDARIQEARRRSVIGNTAKRGRASTFLSQEDQKLGG